MLAGRYVAAARVGATTFTTVSRSARTIARPPPRWPITGSTTPTRTSAASRPKTPPGGRRSTIRCSTIWCKPPTGRTFRCGSPAGEFSRPAPSAASPSAICSRNRSRPLATTCGTRSARRRPNVTPILHYDEWTIGTNLAWELDFWGRFRRAIESADAKLDSSVENYDDVLVLLLSEVAQSYVERPHGRAAAGLRRTERRGPAEESEPGGSEVSGNGATTRLDVTQGQSNLSQTEATIPPLVAARRQAANQLCILHGHAAAGHRGDARPADHPHGLAAGGGGHSRRPLAPPARRPPRRTRGRRPVRPDRRRHRRAVSPFLDHRHDLLRRRPVQGPLRGRLAGRQRGTVLPVGTS